MLLYNINGRQGNRCMHLIVRQSTDSNIETTRTASRQPKASPKYIWAETTASLCFLARRTSTHYQILNFEQSCENRLRWRNLCASVRSFFFHVHKLVTYANAQLHTLLNSPPAPPRIHERPSYMRIVNLWGVRARSHERESFLGTSAEI